LLKGFNFVSATADHIETPSVFEIVDFLFSDFHVFSGEDTFGTVEKSEKLRVFVSALDVIVDADDDIVATSSLTA
jgi:hypothetical protein